MTEDKFNGYFDELNTLVLSSIADSQDEPDIEKRKKKIIDDCENELILGYLYGVEDSNEMLSTNEEVNIENMYDAINRKIDNKTYKDRIREYVEAGTFGMIAVVLATEFHRVFNQAVNDVATSSVIKGLIDGNLLVKEWVTVGDDKVRETHEFIDGVEVPFFEKFYTFDGDGAMFPGDFEDVSNNANCRCIVRYKLNREVLKTQN